MRAIEVCSGLDGQGENDRGDNDRADFKEPAGAEMDLVTLDGEGVERVRTDATCFFSALAGIFPGAAGDPVLSEQTTS